MSVHRIPRKQAYGVKLLQWVVELGNPNVNIKNLNDALVGSRHNTDPRSWRCVSSYDCQANNRHNYYVWRDRNSWYIHFHCWCEINIKKIEKGLA